MTSQFIIKKKTNNYKKNIKYFDEGFSHSNENIKINDGNIKYNIHFVFRFSYNWYNGVCPHYIEIKTIEKTLKNNKEIIDLEMESNEPLIDDVKKLIWYSFV